MLNRPFNILLLIVALSFLLRFFMLTTNPPGLYWDEVSNGYNAYSILKTARDEYGVFLPTVFRSYDDYKPPVYIYTLVPSIAIFDLGEFAVRFPSALAGVLTVMLTYFLTKKITGNYKIALFAAFFLAISPWHLQFSRGGFEANFMQFLTLLGIILFLYSFNKSWLLPLSAVSFGLALNTYQGAKIWIPLVLIMLILFYKKERISFGRKLILPTLILILSTLPILSNFQNSILRGKSVSIFSQKQENTPELLIKGYLNHYSPSFLFSRGDSIGRHSVSGTGELYAFELPLIFLGLFYYIVRQNIKHRSLLLSWFLLAPIPAALSDPTPHALRSITFLPIWSIFSAIGLFRLITSEFLKRIKPLYLSSLFIISLFNLVLYLHLYYVHYPKEKGPDWQDGYRDLISYVDNVKDNYESIAISEVLGKSYIYTLFYLKYDPKAYQQNGNSQAFDKFEFFKYSWEKTKPGRALIISSSFEGTGPKVLKEIYNTNKDPVFRISESE